MALDKDRLGNAWADAIIASMGANAPNASDETSLRDNMKLLADVLINDEFIPFTSVLVASVSGVTPGGGVSGPGTGTIL